MKLFKKSIAFQNTRQLYEWINLMSNAIDINRLREFGPDRTCAEWLLRNGAKIKLLNGSTYIDDYNIMPPLNMKFKIKEVDAADSSIMHNGFVHFKDCKFIDKLVLHNCCYLYNEALGQLFYLKDSLSHLQITNCQNLSEDSLQSLRCLNNLKTLILSEFQPSCSFSLLKNSLPHCYISFKCGVLN